MTEDADCTRRHPWQEGPAPDADGWLAFGDDELLLYIQTLPPEHTLDEPLLGVVRSNRHFFLRQEAAKKIRDTELLMDCAQDRHVGQILVRRLSRVEDAEYLERLVAESHHLDVRKAALAQLEQLRAHLAGGHAPAQAAVVAFAPRAPVQEP